VIRAQAKAFALILLAAAAVLAACAPGPRPAVPKPDPGAAVAALEKEIVAGLSGLPDRATLENRTAARALLSASWARLGLEVQVQEYSPEGRNIFAILPATRPSPEWVVIGAHYDSARNSPGANDNATGIALVSAAATAMARVQSRNRNLVFVLFDEEERGLRGSRAFAQKWLDEKRAVAAVLTVDQMGWDADGDRAVELEIPFEGAEAVFSGVAKAMASPVPVLTTNERGSDHSAFRRLGFPAVGLTEEYRHDDTTPHFHRPTDILDTVNFAYLESSTELVIGVLRAWVR